MSRRNTITKRVIKLDPVYDSRLVSMLVTKILKNGKKNIANAIV